jgi:DNA (cytosine-5)-methyltransferase 1
MKILNLYAGIGGNRKLWGDKHEITAVEYKPEIAKIYQDHFPNDKIVVGDAHNYLLKHYKEFDFIWSSPPCPSHSKIRKVFENQNKSIYPDMKLYEEILFLQGYFKGKWCVENVISWYDPLIPPNNIGDHYFWTNFILRSFDGGGRNHYGSIETLQKTKGFDLKKYKGIDKRKALRNCVEPELAKHILDLAINPIELQKSIF